MQLPCVFGFANRVLCGAVDEIKPDIVICVGQAGGRALVFHEPATWLVANPFDPPAPPAVPGEASAGRFAYAALAPLAAAYYRHPQVEHALEYLRRQLQVDALAGDVERAHRLGQHAAGGPHLAEQAPQRR